MRAYRSENVERERDELAEKIEKLEREIDKHHGAIHTIDDSNGPKLSHLAWSVNRS